MNLAWLHPVKEIDWKLKGPWVDVWHALPGSFWDCSRRLKGVKRRTGGGRQTDAACHNIGRRGPSTRKGVKRCNITEEWSQEVRVLNFNSILWNHLCNLRCVARIGKRPMTEASAWREPAEMCRITLLRGGKNMEREGGLIGDFAKNKLARSTMVRKNWASWNRPPPNLGQNFSIFLMAHSTDSGRWHRAQLCNYS